MKGMKGMRGWGTGIIAGKVRICRNDESNNQAMWQKTCVSPFLKTTCCFCVKTSKTTQNTSESVENLITRCKCWSVLIGPAKGLDLKSEIGFPSGLGAIYFGVCIIYIHVYHI